VVIERITDAQGKLLFEAPAAEAPVEEQRVLPARNVFITNSLLNDVTRYGTAARAQQQLRRPDLYGKTGTTNDAVDAWFAGFQPKLVAVAWMGYDQPRSLGDRESGGRLALPIWIDYMAQALKGVPVAKAPEPPAGVERTLGDWSYTGWADGEGVHGIGLEEQGIDVDAAAALSAAAAAAAGLPLVVAPAPGAASAVARDPAAAPPRPPLRPAESRTPPI
jgi:penicillin-binding protein 1A